MSIAPCVDDAADYSTAGKALRRGPDCAAAPLRRHSPDPHDDLFHPMSASPAFHLRSYGAPSGLDRHDFVQWVLPVCGDLDVEVDAQGGRLDVLRGAYVGPCVAHDQTARGENRFLIVDCPITLLDDHAMQHWRRSPLLALPAPVRGLARAAARVADAGGAVDPAFAAQGLAVVLRSFAPAGSRARLHALCALIEQCPGQAWPVARMALEMGVTSSRLHAVFREVFELTPQAWLGGARLRWARARLAQGEQPIAWIAQQAGFSEQSALTRALRRECGVTPAEYRRRCRQ